MKPIQPKENSSQGKKHTVFICQHTSCQRNGAEAVLEAFQQGSRSEITIIASPCMGQCSCGPTVRIGSDETWYYRVRPEDVPQIIEQHLINGEPVKNKLNPRIHQIWAP